MAEFEARIQTIGRYPIKSFQGEEIASTSLQANGILADRPLALRHRETGKVVSGKHKAFGERVLEFHARYEKDPVAGEALPAIVATIDGKECSTGDAEAFARRCSEAPGAEVDLVTAGGESVVYETYWPVVDGLMLSDQTIDFPLSMAEAGSFADLEPLHILTTASLAELAKLAPESAIVPARFRPSLLLDTGEASGFVENDWVGRTAHLGGAKLEFGGAAPRCIMTTRPQAGLPKDIGVLQTLARENRQEVMGLPMPCLGNYAKVIEPGPVSVGDTLRFD